MFIGGSAGSTSGGFKIVRHLLLIKKWFLEFKECCHPNAIVPVRYNNKSVPSEIVYNILGFLYNLICYHLCRSLGFAFLGLDFESSIGVAASSLGNVGPALGSLAF